MTAVVPWFEDFNVGDDYSDVPAVTITEGHAAIHHTTSTGIVYWPSCWVRTRVVSAFQ